MNRRIGLTAVERQRRLEAGLLELGAPPSEPELYRLMRRLELSTPAALIGYLQNQGVQLALPKGGVFELAAAQEPIGTLTALNQSGRLLRPSLRKLYFLLSWLALQPEGLCGPVMNIQPSPLLGGRYSRLEVRTLRFAESHQLIDRGPRVSKETRAYTRLTPAGWSAIQELEVFLDGETDDLKREVMAFQTAWQATIEADFSPSVATLFSPLLTVVLLRHLADREGEVSDLSLDTLQEWCGDISEWWIRKLLQDSEAGGYLTWQRVGDGHSLSWTALGRELWHQYGSRADMVLPTSPAVVGVFDEADLDGTMGGLSRAPEGLMILRFIRQRGERWSCPQLKPLETITGLPNSVLRQLLPSLQAAELITITKSTIPKTPPLFIVLTPAGLAALEYYGSYLERYERLPAAAELAETLTGIAYGTRGHLYQLLLYIEAQPGEMLRKASLALVRPFFGSVGSTAVSALLKTFAEHKMIERGGRRSTSYIRLLPLGKQIRQRLALELPHAPRLAAEVVSRLIRDLPTSMPAPDRTRQQLEKQFLLELIAQRDQQIAELQSAHPRSAGPTGPVA
ncbi:MAG TPA: hypothetical protein VMT30_06895 [Candidatus Saccharimonadia bacterium]|nr:hypothetical protein [Candidatus Saccharimonadia bacterium]